jgi:hypothetical protein
MEAALGLAPAQEKDQNAYQACLVRGFSTSFVPSLVLILAQVMVVLVAFAVAVKAA